MVVQEYGTPDGWELIANDNQQGAQNMAEKFKPYLNIIKEGKRGSQGYSYTLADGSYLWFTVRNPNCNSVRGTGSFANSCGLIELSLTGKNTNNIADEAGKTFFQFILAKNGIVPSGSQDDAVYSFEKNCLATKGGYGCGAWILLNENMDYLHCDDLAWGGKTKCD
jgi:hypothetical protein